MCVYVCAFLPSCIKEFLLSECFVALRPSKQYFSHVVTMPPNQLCTAHSVFDIGHCTVIHCDAGGLTNEKQKESDIRLTDQ